MRKTNILVCSFAILCASAVSASASSVTPIGNVDGTTWYVDNIATWASTGNTIGGMTVTVNFNNGYHQTVSWVANSGAVGDGWSLTMPNPNIYGVNGYSDNTWYSDAYWNLINTGSTSTGNSAITSLIFEGQPGNVVFDIYSGRNDIYDTLISDYGRYITADATDGSGVGATASYSNLVAVTNTNPVGDLYHTLTLNFTGLGAGNTFRFAMDTDNVNDRPPVPEPATLILLGSGIVGIAAFRRRKSQ